MKEFYISKTVDAADLPLPQYHTSGSSGMDLYANIHEDVLINCGEIYLVPTGIKIAMPQGYEAQIRPRSGLALNHGISLVNSPGTVDSDYRGEIKVIMINHGKEPFLIKRGNRIAQLVVCAVSRVDWEETSFLPETERNNGGFGHTGDR